MTFLGRWGLGHHLRLGILDLLQNWWWVAEKCKSEQTRVQPACNWDTSAARTCRRCTDSWLLRGTRSQGKGSTGLKAAGMWERAGRASRNRELLHLSQAARGQHRPYRRKAGLKKRRGWRVSPVCLSLQQCCQTLRKAGNRYPLVNRKGASDGAKQPRKEKENIQGLKP